MFNTIYLMADAFTSTLDCPNVLAAPAVSTVGQSRVGFRYRRFPSGYHSMLMGSMVLYVAFRWAMDGNPGIAAPAVSLGLPSNGDVQHDSSTSQGSGADAFAEKYFFEVRTHRFDAALLSLPRSGVHLVITQNR